MLTVFVVGVYVHSVWANPPFKGCEPPSFEQNQLCVEACSEGFVAQGDTCIDIDECFDQRHNCHGTAVCVNTVGHFYCECPDGHVGDGVLEECVLDLALTCPSNDDIDWYNPFAEACYQYGPDHLNCKPKNNCKPCGDTCIPMHGSWECHEDKGQWHGSFCNTHTEWECNGEWEEENRGCYSVESNSDGPVVSCQCETIPHCLGREFTSCVDDHGPTGHLSMCRECEEGFKVYDYNFAVARLHGRDVTKSRTLCCFAEGTQFAGKKLHSAEYECVCKDGWTGAFCDKGGVPGSVLNLQASAAPSGASLSWEMPLRAQHAALDEQRVQHYVVTKCAQKGSCDWKNQLITTKTTSMWHLSLKKAYYFIVQTRNNAGVLQPYSVKDTTDAVFALEASVPAQPLSLTIDPQLDHCAVMATWFQQEFDNGSPLLGFVIAYDGHSVSVAPGVRSHTFEAVAHGGFHANFTIKAFNELGSSVASEAVAAQVPPCQSTSPTVVVVAVSSGLLVVAAVPFLVRRKRRMQKVAPSDESGSGSGQRPAKQEYIKMEQLG